MNEKPTVLFVDDEERILRSLKMMFRSEYNVLTTTTGIEALEIVLRQKVHVVISDQRMPVMLGVDLLREIKTVSPNSIRILLTGYADKDAVIGSINEGEVFRYINKPWNQDEIRSVLSKAVEISLNADDIELELPTVSGKKVIMVLDEDPKAADIIYDVLKQDFDSSYSMVWADSLESAVKLINRGSIAVVVAELHLAGEDVSAFVKILKNQSPQIVTVVSSSYQDINMLVGLINEGQIHRFLPKPLRRGMIATALKGALNYYNTSKIRPVLLTRHKIELPKSVKEESSVAGRIMGLFRNLRQSS
jgi:DNA-binding NtrC family response regulator